jgi:hypothetical protein
MAGKYQKNRIQHKGSLRVCLLLVLILLASGGIGTTVAKYIHSTDGKMLVKAPEFYFTSDLLTEDGNVSYMLNSNTTQVQFLLRSTADELRNSDMKIGYTVSLEKPEDASGYLDITEGELTGTEKTKTVTLRDVQPGVTYTVTAIGEAGYTQELSATFRVADKDQNVYKNLTQSPDGYLLLTVWTHNVEGDLTISIPAGLIPDNTNPEMSEVYNVEDPTKNSFTSSFEKYTSKTYRFFGTTTGEIKVTGTVGESTYIVNESALP